MSGPGWCISRAHDAAVYSDDTWYCTSGETASGWSGITPSPSVRHIAGVGSSPLVRYEGSGMYFVDETGEGLSLEILPDVRIVGDPFQKGDGVSPVTLLDESTPHPLSIRLARWEKADASLYAVHDGERTFLYDISGTQALTLAPGRYLILQK